MPLSDITNKTSKKSAELDDFTRGMICGLVKHAKWSQADVVLELDIPKQTVSDVYRKFNKNGQTSTMPRSGRPKKLDERDERHLVINVRREPYDPLGIYLSQLQELKGSITLATIRKALRKKGFYSFRPAKKPFLSLRHRKARKEWAMDKLDWTDADWSTIIWTDESRFALKHNDGGIRVIRQKGERLYNRHVLPTFKFGKGSVMVWGCFWAEGLGPLVTLKGKVDQEKYIKCLEEHFLPWYNKLKDKHGHDFILQEDGASCHTGSHTSRWKREAEITLMES
jgi:transposase